jgi:7,8-dihydropterin-6-yl-methyl-4-(beta-D-ribofuranosyl)aminobenzene 5'-phosphate synthase
MIVLSHCHFDHTGGLKGMLDKINKNIPIIAHTDIFRENYMFKPCLKNIGMTGDNTREKITASGGQLVLTDKSVRLMDGVVTTGEVERTTEFEKSFIGSYNLEDGKMIPDDIKDDISIVTTVKDKGIFIITGCSHAGIINIIKHAQKITGIEKVYGIIGGLHLIESPNETELSKERILKTAKSFAEMNLELVVAGHCTGILALNEIKNAVGDKFVQLHSGQIIEL